MSNVFSKFYSAHVTFRTCVGLLLCSLSLATQAAQPELPQLDLFTIQLTHTDTKHQSSYQFSTAVANTTANSLVFGKSSRLPTFSELKKGTFWSTSIRWHLTDNGNHASLSPQFRLESKESRIEIRPLQRSVWMTWRRELS